MNQPFDPNQQTTQAQYAAGYDEDEISLVELATTLGEEKKLIFGLPFVAGILAIVVSLLLTPIFTAKTTLLPPQNNSGGGAAAAALASLGGLAGLAGISAGGTTADTVVAMLKSRSAKDQIIDQFNLIEYYEAELREDVYRTLDEVVNVSSDKKTSMITLEVDDKDPKLAADMANAYFEVLKGLMTRVAVTEAQQRRAFFEKQLSLVQAKMIAAEQALRATGVNSSVLKSNPTSAVAAVAALKAQVTAQEVKVGAMRGYLADTAPDFKQALNELSNLRAQLAKQEKDEPASAAGQGDYVAKYREFKYQETLFDLFAKQFELAKIDESREGAVIQVLDAAQPPEKKAKPKKALIAIIATLAAGFALLLFVFIRQALHNANKDPESAQKLAALKTSWQKALGKAN